MSDIVKSLTSNPLIKNTLLKQLKNTLRENNIDLVEIRLTPDGELFIEAYSEKMTVIKTDEFNQLVNIATNGIE